MLDAAHPSLLTKALNMLILIVTLKALYTSQTVLIALFSQIMLIHSNLNPLYHEYITDNSDTLQYITDNSDTHALKDLNISQIILIYSH